MAKQYLGDGVFAEFDSATLNVILTTENGERETNRIVMEPEVLDALGRFTQRAIYERQRRQPLDARAHLGDGESAAREAGAVCGDLVRDHNDHRRHYQCTLPIGHDGDHFSEIAKRGWIR